MKCFLLAAGKGTRLKPLTDLIPKCLVPINDKELLQYWLDLLCYHKIFEVLINVHHKPEKILQFISNYSGNMTITTIWEKSLLGSLGTLTQNIEKYSNDKTILVCYADNLTNMDISKLIKFHNSHSSPISVALFRTNYPKQCGIVELDSDQNIISFEEKPKNPKSNLANAGIYIIEVVELKKNKKNTEKIMDIGYHFLPQYINNMKGFLIDKFICDIGNFDNLKFANKYVSENIKDFVDL